MKVIIHPGLERDRIAARCCHAAHIRTGVKNWHLGGHEAERSAEGVMGEGLSRRLDAFMASFMDRVDPATARVVIEAEAALRRSGALDGALRVGEAAPEFELPDQNGRAVSLRRQLATGPVVLTFFRGGWCPFCSLALRALDEVARDIDAAGATIIAISPQTTDNAAATAERNFLSFPVLTDAGNAVARRYGLVWHPGAELRSLYDRLGHALPRINGSDDWTLPIPAGFVVGRDGRVTYAHVDSSLTRRLEPQAALAAAREAASSGAAAPPAGPAA